VFLVHNFYVDIMIAEKRTPHPSTLITQVLTASAAAAGSVLFSLYPDLDNVGGSAHSRVNGNGAGGAVVNTGAAFHAGVVINKTGLVFLHLKNRMWTHLCAQGAADAFFFVQHQGGYIFQIS
jgi:hypothetical protein